jgi:hypothetical protein
MTNTQLAPMTSAEMTTTKISHATKIGKQVMKSELAKALLAAKKEKESPEALLLKTYKKSHTIIERFLRGKVDLALRNDSMVNGMLKFMEFTCSADSTKSGEIELDDLIYTTDASSASSWLCGSYHSGCSSHRMDKFIESESVNVYVTFSISVEIGGRDQNASMEIVVPLTDELLEAAKVRRALVRQVEEVQAKIAHIQDKIKNIDTVVEEMEANLLVKELQTSVEGQEVLDITSDLVSQMLGDTPKLLGRE